MRQAAPRVTVTIPTHNRAELLRQALRSVLEQSLADVEVFVSDNASTDETPEVVASFDDPRVRYMRLDRNIGVAGNLSRCLRLGTAPFLAILQDDDLMLPSNLERKVEVLERHPNVGIAHASFQVIGSDGRVLRENVNWCSSEADTIESGELFVRCSIAEASRINMSSAVMRRSVVEAERFDEADGRGAEDYGLWLRIGRRADVAFISETLTCLRIHDEADSVQAGVNAIEGGRYHMTLAQLALAQHVKRRFLARSGYGFAERRELRRLARDWGHRQILRLVLARTLPDRSPVETFRLLLEGARIEPGFLVSPKAARVLLASLVGARGRELANRFLAGSGSRPR